MACFCSESIFLMTFVFNSLSVAAILDKKLFNASRLTSTAKLANEFDILVGSAEANRRLTILTKNTISIATPMPHPPAFFLVIFYNKIFTRIMFASHSSDTASLTPDLWRYAKDYQQFVIIINVSSIFNPLINPRFDYCNICTVLLYNKYTVTISWRSIFTGHSVQNV